MPKAVAASSTPLETTSKKPFAWAVADVPNLSDNLARAIDWLSVSLCVFGSVELISTNQKDRSQPKRIPKIIQRYWS